MNQHPHAPKGGYRAKQALGQHFISDEKLLDELVRLSNVGEEDSVFEIGPGLGGLTAALAKTARQVIALEVDQDLLPILRVTLHGCEHVQVVQGDVMTTDLHALLSPLGPFHVVANLPYYLTTPILNRLFHLSLPVQSINVMVQKEAADRLVAQPDMPSYGPLAVLAQYKAEPRVVMDIPRSAFSPPPKAESVFVCMPMRSKPPIEVADEARLFRLVSAAFAMRRKTLLNNLMPAFGLSREQAEAVLEAAGLDTRVRGEALDLPAFARLAEALSRSTAIAP
ncbi:MAG: ribosomal RNA small subunit methyltransferase A [Clostridiales bacterium]|jgi:16S rRNA (adenine1518-N6/adenine1519-N6)-dimethyltransferase|nr:ribosomal RNA small subunit methyltransferase A [Clostridiales bacterium]